MERKKEVIWAYLLRKGKKLRDNKIQESYIKKYTSHPEWDLYIIQQGEPEKWGFRKISEGAYELYSCEFLRINPGRKGNTKRSRNKSSSSKNHKLSGNVEVYKNNNGIQTMKEWKPDPGEYCKFLKKLPLTTKKWSSIEPSKTKSGRLRLLEKYGPYAFLDPFNPEKPKYPIISRKGEFSEKGLLAAFKRARQYGDEEIAELAEKIGKCMGLAWAKLNPSKIQSVLFDRSKWKLKEAREWLREHGFDQTHLYERSENYYRFPQLPAEKFKYYRTIDFGKGIKAIIGFNEPLKNPDGEGYNTSMATLKDVIKRLEDIEKHIKRLKKLEGIEKQLKSINRGLSYVAEGFSQEGLKEAFEKLGYKGVNVAYTVLGPEERPDFIVYGWKRKKRYLFVVEVKNSITGKDELRRAINQVEKYRKKYNADKGIIGAIKFPDNLRKEALRRGIWVIVPSGNAFKLIRE